MQTSPTPWVATGSETTVAVYINDANGKRIATMKPCETDWNNAKTMAEAPRLLEILRAICSDARMKDEDDNRNAAVNWRYIVAAREIIRKCTD